MGAWLVGPLPRPLGCYGATQATLEPTATPVAGRSGSDDLALEASPASNSFTPEMARGLPALLRPL